MNILITGGAGYLGCSLVENLSKNKDVEKIVIYDNLSRQNYNIFFNYKIEKNIIFIKGDLLDTRKLSKAIDGIDIIFHLAAKVSTPFADNNPHEFDQVNNWGTSELINTVEKSNSIKKFIYISSASVYGASDSNFNIDSPTNPKTFYGLSKLKGEKHVQRLFQSDIQTLIFRAGNIYGFGSSLRMDSVINKFIFQANYNKNILIQGDGNQKRSFIHIDRISNFLHNILNDNMLFGVYNLVEQSYSISHIVEQLRVLYPNLEYTLASQDMPMRNLSVIRDERLNNFYNPMEFNLLEDLRHFKTHFSF